MPEKAEGSFTAPPPGAPQETTVAGSERATPEQIAAARANERELPPYTPGAKPMTLEQQAAFLGKTVEEVQELQAKLGIPSPSATAPPRTADHAPPTPPVESQPQTIYGPDGHPVTSGTKPPDQPISGLRKAGGLRTVHKPPPESTPVQATAAVAPEPVAEPTPEQAATPEPTPPAPTPEPAALPPPADPAEPYRPAQSNTDSPSRGIPTASPDPGKRITGGFGDAGEAQYFPLDGTELRELVNGLMDTIHAQLEDDLRFSIAAAYPRCTARVVVEVEAYGMDQTMTVQKVMPPHEKTPLEVARTYGDQIVFVVVAERAEMTADGQSVVPPNATRQELGLPVPRKTAVQTPGGRMLVDVKE